jgi:hypothetical protein
MHYARGWNRGRGQVEGVFSDDGRGIEMIQNSE